MDVLGSLSPLLTPSGTAAHNSPERISKAAREFEGILLRSLLEPLQKSFSKISGESDPAGQDDYQYMGTEALASALASSGGLGIADMITKQLTRASARTEK
jgi:Rod binding domain-containing protein